ncbi:Aldehyde dehydrogenase family protein [Streptomyces sp. DvalAA-14]|uniref:aldehyde dehydrogenase family protein n=1 Tax=Streptomyces sp. DvalAA-14 TaxID=1839759 RepID=UPI00081B501F|nr:aldehyde dehydrogenase family protein [Streptomyces sp. SID4948]SCE40112.1 Aldehyde dehydrogenase family protein [Streptomyces sp. DvalAA-14]
MTTTQPQTPSTGRAAGPQPATNPSAPPVPWHTPAGDGVIEVRSPHDQRLVGRTPEAAPEDVDRAMAAARDAFDHGPWRRLQEQRLRAGVRAARPGGIRRAEVDRHRRRRLIRSGFVSVRPLWKAEG